MQAEMIAKAKELLRNGTVDRVMGWKKGEFVYDVTPAVFTAAEELDAAFVYNGFTAANVSKYLIKESRKDGRILAFLKPCDSFSFMQLMKEHRVRRENVYIVGIESWGKADVEKIKAAGISGITDIREEGSDFIISTAYGDEHTVGRFDVLLERCLNCKSKKHAVYDELLGDEGQDLKPDRFAEVEKLEAMTPDERFAFWRSQLSKCIRCNACRNVCPACSCVKCVFDNPNSGVQAKANVDDFEENLFHIIRAFHVAGRCTDCGECSRVCPQGIPLHLLNRKFIRDIDEFYGEYQAGAEVGSRAPLVNFTQEDVEPGIVMERGVK